MTVFTPGISPYSYANNDPINNIDYYGLGIVDWWRKIKDVVMSVLGYESRGIWGVNHQFHKIKKGGKYNPSFERYAAHDPQGPNPSKHPHNDHPINLGGPIPPDLKSQVRGFIPVNNTDDNDPDEDNSPTPHYKDQDIPAGKKITFAENVYFVSSTDKFYDIPRTEKTLAELVRTLQGFPELTVFIYGNVDTDFEITGSSDVAISQSMQFNGTGVPAKELMNARAKAVYKYLRSKGINPKRMNYGAGNVYNTKDGSGMKTTFELRNF